MIDIVRAATGANKPVAGARMRIRPEKSEVREADRRREPVQQGNRLEARRSDLKDGVARTVDWWRGQHRVAGRRGPTPRYIL